MNNKQVLFDVGANVGNYTKLLTQSFPNAFIHCFEPLNTTYTRLVKNTDNSNCLLNNFGLSDIEGEKLIYYNDSSEELLGLSSLYQRQLGHMNMTLSQSEIIKLSTIDKYCNQNNITSIDFLKLDVEGSEYEVLLGATEMIKKNNIKAIQIEFGGADIDARLFFRDFWDMLNEKYYVYRILQDNLLRIEEYNEGLEIFSTTNYLFINKMFYKN